jgi:hypothetical protein
VVQEAGSFGAAYAVEHTVERAIGHTLHGIGAGIDRSFHTHIFHDDDVSDRSRDWAGKGGADAGGDAGGGEDEAGGGRGGGSEDEESSSTHGGSVTSAAATGRDPPEDLEVLKALEPTFHDASNLKLEAEAAAAVVATEPEPEAPKKEEPLPTTVAAAATQEEREPSTTTAIEGNGDLDNSSNGSGGGDRGGGDGAQKEDQQDNADNSAHGSPTSFDDDVDPAPHPLQPTDPASPPSPSLSSPSSPKWPILLGSMNRKLAQKTVLTVLDGKTRMLPDKTPVQSFHWDQPTAPPHAPQCEDTHKEGAVVHVGDVFKNNVKDHVGYSHMAMISQMPGPHPVWKWVVVWQCSPGIEGTGDMHLRAAFSDNLRAWSPSVEVNVKKESPPKAVWAPVLHLHRADPAKPGDRDVLWLFFAESTKCLRHFPDMPPRWSPGGDIRAVSSVDGISWTKPKTLITGQEEGGNPKVVANKLAVTPSGVWVLPYWGEVSSARGCHTSQATVSGVLVSKDRGHTWRATGKVYPRGGRIIEGTVATLPSGGILQMWRSRQGVLLQSTSRDRDAHGWPQPHKSDRRFALHPTPFSRSSYTLHLKSTS